MSKSKFILLSQITLAPTHIFEMFTIVNSDYVTFYILRIFFLTAAASMVTFWAAQILLSVLTPINVIHGHFVLN